MMKTYLFHAFCVVAVLAMISPAQAALTYYEGFNYAATASIDGVGGWSNANDTVGISATGLTYTNLVTEGGSAKYAQAGGNSAAGNYATKEPAGVAALFNSTSSTFYMSVLFGDTASPSNNSPGESLWLFQSDGVGGWNDDGITIGSNNGADPRPGINIHQFGGGENGVNADSTAGTKLMAMRYTMKVGADAVDLILNPDITTLTDSDFDTPTVTSNGELTDTTGELDYFIMYFGGAGMDTLLDEIRIGSVLSEVFPMIPEPATLFVLGLGLVPVLLRRRR